jgi:hypothetical protein
MPENPFDVKTAPAEAATSSPKSAAPVEVPAKFRDPKTGDLDAEALLRSYLELERKLARTVELPAEGGEPEADPAFRRALGVPDTPDGYPIEIRDGVVEIDPEVNRLLHQAGFTPKQAQLVYDLAAERLGPAAQAMAQSFEADRQLEAVSGHFGGEEKWREVSKALAAWGRKNLPPEVFEAMSTTSEGIIAMHRMMVSGEPGLARDAAPAGPDSEDALKRLMADPRYWRDRDPSVVRQVSEGFKRLFPGGGAA